MATGERNTIKEPVTTYINKDVIILTLSEEEARFLQDIMNTIGGDREKSRRKYEESITSALRESGVTLWGNNNDIEGSLTCHR